MFFDDYHDQDLAHSVKMAQKQAYAIIDRIHFDGP